MEGVSEHIGDEQAVSFAMHKDLNTIVVSTENGLHTFDYENELKHMQSLSLANVDQICFVNEYIVAVYDDEDSDEAVLRCYEMFSNEILGEIRVKQFLGQKVMVRAAESSVCFGIGTQIGRI